MFVLAAGTVPSISLKFKSSRHRQSMTVYGFECLIMLAGYVALTPCNSLWYVYKGICDHIDIPPSHTRPATLTPTHMFPNHDDVMETFSALLAFCMGNSPVTGECPSQRPVMRSFGVFFDLRLNKRLSKQSRLVRLVVWDAIALIKTSL